MGRDCSKAAAHARCPPDRRTGCSAPPLVALARLALRDEGPEEDPARLGGAGGAKASSRRPEAWPRLDRAAPGAFARAGGPDSANDSGAAVTAEAEAAASEDA